MPDKSADSIMDAIKHFKGERNLERFYSDRSGEIDRALRDRHIVPDNSQHGAPQNNVVAERLVQDVLEGTRTALLRAGLPPCFWEHACRHYCAMGNARSVRKLASADGDRSSPWEKTHEESLSGEAHSNWVQGDLQAVRDKTRQPVQNETLCDYKGIRWL